LKQKTERHKLLPAGVDIPWADVVLPFVSKFSFIYLYCCWLRRWVVKKLKVEIEELLQTKAAKRLLKSISIKDLNLGKNAPGEA